MSGVVTKSGYAEHRGCSPAYISKLIRQGKLAAPALMPDGKINVVLADQMLGASSAADDLLAAPRGAAGAGPTYAVERARREAAERELKELALAKQKGEQLSRGAVDAAGEVVFGRAVSAFMDLWPDLSVEFARMTDAGAIAERGQAAMRLAMSRIHEEFMEDAARRSVEAR